MDFLYRCAYQEVRGESLIGQLWFFNVILNRLQDIRWPDTIDEIVTQPYQFSIAERTIELPILRWLCDLCYDRNIPIVTNATHYHTVDTKPYWADKLHFIATVGNHRFYKE